MGARDLRYGEVMADERVLDIVVFGATGFTGGLVAQYLSAHRGKLRWALAGRDQAKLERVRDGLQNQDNRPQIVVANANDERSLRAMAKDTRVVLTTVGPFLRYGEPLLRACAESGTHYVDLTGEPPFVALTRERYHAIAKANGAKLINACGFDSIPHDLGAYFTLHKLRARLPDSERDSAAITIEGIVRASGAFSGGTWHSALETMSTLRSGNRALTKTPSTDGRRVGATPSAISFRSELALWTVPMPTIDPWIVRESARALPEYGPNFRYGHFLGLKHWYQVAGLLAGVGSVFALAQFGPTRSLLEKLKLPGDGPDADTRSKSWFRVIFQGHAAGRKVHCEVRGGDPGYGETAKMISEAALSLAFDELPPHYGAVTTAVALGQALIDRLVKAGISFEEI
ncbi:MAG: saccharopine dehydrogenase [Myxococcaceae bacterium]|nr:saccharopine dehydrogenase [Myxococcaceae bacterium]